MLAIYTSWVENNHMAEVSSEHLVAGQIEQAALSEITLHALQCERCAGLIIHYAQTRESVPLEQYPAAE